MIAAAFLLPPVIFLFVPSASASQRPAEAQGPFQVLAATVGAHTHAHAHIHTHKPLTPPAGLLGPSFLALFHIRPHIPLVSLYSLAPPADCLKPCEPHTGRYRCSTNVNCLFSSIFSSAPVFFFLAKLNLISTLQPSRTLLALFISFSCFTS